MSGGRRQGGGCEDDDADGGRHHAPPGVRSNSGNNVGDVPPAAEEEDGDGQQRDQQQRDQQAGDGEQQQQQQQQQQNQEQALPSPAGGPSPSPSASPSSSSDAAGGDKGGTGKWAVVLARGYGTSQKWKVTSMGAAFPDMWCKQKVRDGYYITAVGGRGGKSKESQQWAVVCTKGVMPGGAQSWRWTGWGDGFPNDWAQKKYDANLRITSVGCTAGRWCVVMSTPPKGCKVKQWWAWRDSWAALFEWIKPKLEKGNCVTELSATAKHCFACVTHTENTEKMKYFWKYDASFPSKDLVAKCDNGYVVECIAGGMGKWAIAAHASPQWGNQHQRWLYHADSFDKFYERHRAENFRILVIDGSK